LLDRNDDLYRLPNTRFDRMLSDPQGERLRQFAGTKVRMADILVETQARRPTRVVRAAFSFLAFDAEGCVDAASFHQQQWARAELALAPLTTLQKFSPTAMCPECKYPPVTEAQPHEALPLLAMSMIAPSLTRPQLAAAQSAGEEAAGKQRSSLASRCAAAVQQTWL
jgi:hypothetical protein